jgi:hypothetical protein
VADGALVLARRIVEGSEPTSAAEALNAPLFHSVVQRMHDAKRWVVLDLGAARNETVRLFGQYRCRLDIADLADGVDALNAEKERRALHDLAESLLPPKRTESTDVVLCWDLINYLSRPALTVIMDSIAARGRPGMVAHALVFYAESKMPERPSSFFPLDEQRLLNRVPQPGVRAAPRYTPEDLARCLPRYTVERARLLRNGMQEFLFRT